MALRAIALLSLPSLAARSKRIGFTLALARCAAICAPMTPAPSTAALRMTIRSPSGAAAARASAESPRAAAGALGESVSDISSLHDGVGDGARLAPLVDRDVGQLCFGHPHGLAPALAAALR